GDLCHGPAGGPPRPPPRPCARLFSRGGEGRGEEPTRKGRHEPPASKRMVERFASDSVGHRPSYGEPSTRRESNRGGRNFIPGKSMRGRLLGGLGVRAFPRLTVSDGWD